MGRHIILVAVGGAAGCVLRFLTTVLTIRYFSGHFPLATYVANILGCFLIGLFSGLFMGSDTSNVQLRLLLITGFCGGYTTFSTFSAENLALMNNNNFSLALINIFASVIAGLIAVWLGLTVAKL
jgi:fluoride exporter